MTPVARARLAAWTGSLVSTQSRGVGRVGETAYLAVIAWLVLLAILRRPEALLSPAFFADDARLYTEALAGAGLLTPYAGYLVVLQRAVMALPVAPAHAPLVGNLMALAVVAFVVALLVVRLRQPWLAGAFVLLPGTWWVLGTMVDIQWVIGVYLLIVAATPRKWDLPFVVVAGLQGPIGLLLLPLFAARWWVKRDSGPILAALAVTAALQVAVLLGFPRNVSADHSEILQAIAMRGFVVPVVGTSALSIWLAIPIAVLLALIVRRLGWWGAGLAFAWLAFMAAGTLYSPYPSHTIWSDLPLTERHFYLPGVAVTATIVLGVQRRMPAAYALGALLLFGMVADFRLPPIQGDWARDSACIGGPEPCSVPVFGGGPGWDVEWRP